MHSRKEREMLEQKLANLLEKLDANNEANKAALHHKILECNDAIFLTYIREIIYNEGFWRQQGPQFVVYNGRPAAIESFRKAYENNADKEVRYQVCQIALLAWREDADRSNSIIGSLNRAIEQTHNLTTSSGAEEWPKNINMEKMKRFIERYMPTVIKQAPEPKSSFHPFENL